MIKLDLPFYFPETKYLNKIPNILAGVRQKYDNGKIGFIDLDESVDTDLINNFVQENKEKFDNVVVLGIGGSALGTRAILTAIKGKYYNELSRKDRKNFPKLYVLDNIDPIEIDDFIKLIDYKKTLFIVISKSGSTIETISQFEFFKKEVTKVGLDLKKHFVIVAGEKSDFKNENLKAGFKVFDIGENVGGRFSVFSNVGLLPLAFVGIDIKKLLNGQKNIKKSYFSSDLNLNLALYLALIQYYLYVELKRNITIFYPYISNLCYFSHWYKQLIGESLGKQGIGITLVDSIGVTDQHSQLQLYYDGPDDKLIIFIELENFEKNFTITGDLSFLDLMKFEKVGTEKSLTEKNKLNLSIKINKLDEKSIAELVFLFEMQIVYLGELLNLDAFNQPGVEVGKSITKKLLKENGKI